MRLCICVCFYLCSFFSAQLIRSSATITATSTAAKIKPELHVHFDCLVLSYRKLYASFMAKSNLHSEKKQQPKQKQEQQQKKSLTDALKAFAKRKEREKKEWSYTRSWLSMLRWKEWVQGNRVGNATWLFTGLLGCCVAVIVCRCVFNWLNEWIAIPSGFLNEEKWNRPLRLRNAHASTHDFQSDRTKRKTKQMQNKNEHETDCR